MNTKKMLAAILRERAAGNPVQNNVVADAIIPSNQDEAILKIALEEGGDASFMESLADYFDDNSAPVEFEPTTAPAAPIPPDVVVEQLQALAEPEYVTLGEDEVIQAGDEWKLKDGLRHSDGRLVMWRPVEGSVGDLVSDHEKSQFRRRKA